MNVIFMQSFLRFMLIAQFNPVCWGSDDNDNNNYNILSHKILTKSLPSNALHILVFGLLLGLKISDVTITVFRFDCGTGIGAARTTNKVVIGEWNSLMIHRVDWNARMTLNDGPEVRTKSKVNVLSVYNNVRPSVLFSLNHQCSMSPFWE